MIILLPVNGIWLSLSPEQFNEAKMQALAIMGTDNPDTASQATQDRILDAKGMQEITGISANWFLEQARNGHIPCVHFGKYVRFQCGEVIEALKSQPRHADRLSVDTSKQETNQRLAKGCYRVATKN